jgi:hypothetical protein
MLRVEHPTLTVWVGVSGMGGRPLIRYLPHAREGTSQDLGGCL